MATHFRQALLVSAAAIALWPGWGAAAIQSQCPGGEGVVCRHIVGADGFVNMADSIRNPTDGGRGRLQYMFGFFDVTGVPDDQVMEAGFEAGQLAAPTIVLDEGDQFYLTLSNVGMSRRPDLFDPHSVHWHGFPQASAIFDGVPEASMVPNPAASFTYFYNVVEPGTYIYHCHVEATEHMQMGMLGNLYVRPRQDKSEPGQVLGSYVHKAGDRYAYNDGDGSTRYDVDFPIQIHSFDAEFHDASLTVQPLPFALMRDTYGMLNGRGYPETINPAVLNNSENGHPSQPIPALIEANSGQKILLRLSNLSVTRYFTLSASGLPMQVVGQGARILKGRGQSDGTPLYYRTGSVTLGGGETADVLIDTAAIPAGTYFLHATELNYLSNGDEDMGGIMTEIVIRQAAVTAAKGKGKNK